MDICTCSAFAFHSKSQRILGKLCYLDIMTNCFLVKSFPIGQALFSLRPNFELPAGPSPTNQRVNTIKKMLPKFQCIEFA
jgi:hypothetical protein